jgi:hypothetical protein
MPLGAEAADECYVQLMITTMESGRSDQQATRLALAGFNESDDDVLQSGASARAKQTANWRAATLSFWVTDDVGVAKRQHPG